MTNGNSIFDEVQGRYNGPRLEQEILQLWDKKSIFEKSLEQSKGKPRFSFNEGPPTANGKPGIHHVLARTFKDIYLRYKSMQGFYVPRKGGWDTHGLPVEHEIEKDLGIFDKKEIEQQVGISEFTRRCRTSVMAYISEWEAMTKRMGYWVNLNEAYYTLNNEYIESVWNLLKRIWCKGLIYKKYKVVPYDPKIGATLSSHEVAQGYKKVEDPSITVRFQLRDEDNCAFLVWTTTPWTLPSNLLLAVGEDIDYTYVRYGKETLILASSMIDASFAEEPYEVIKTVKGKELVGMRYERLFDYLPIESGDCFRVVAADFVNTEDGTMIVHIAPAYGINDLELGHREGLPVIHGVGLDGYFKPEVTPVAGLFFKEADPILCDILMQRGIMFRNEKILHNYPFGWRTGDPLLYYAKEAWYIKTTEIKDQMVALNKTINWIPETIRNGRFGNWLENNIDWVLSRERFWGTPLPVWINEDGDCICIGSLQELEELSGQQMSNIDLHRPQIDKIIFIKDGKTYRRVPEVIDCWFDSGAMPYAQWHYPFENQEEFEKHFPADYICEAIDQTRGWFYTLHAIASLVDNNVAYKNCVCLSHIVDEKGKKMSKSLGNIVNPYYVFDTTGADALRWLFLARTALDAQKRISVDIVREVAASFINTLWNVYAFFILYARLDQIDLNRPIEFSERPEIDRWILALTHQTLKTVTESLDQYDAYSAGQGIEKLVDQLSNWYVRRNRRRFWKSIASDDKQSAYLTLYECLDLLQRMIAPFMPFLSEAMYQNLSKYYSQSEESVHLSSWPKYNKTFLDQKLVFEMNVVQHTVGLGRSAREECRVRLRQPLSKILICTPDVSATAAIEKHKQQILEELNVKSIEFIHSATELVNYHIKPNFSRLGKQYGELMPKIKAALAQADGTWISSEISQGKTFSLDIDDQSIECGPDDVQIQTSSAQGYSSSEGNGYLVAFDTTLNESLIIEGLAREIVRTVQDARKSSGLKIADRIYLSVDGSVKILSAADQYREYIETETLGKLVERDKVADGFESSRSLEDESWTICLMRA